MEQKQQLVTGRQEGGERLAEQSMGVETLVRAQMSKAPLPRLNMTAPTLQMRIRVKQNSTVTQHSALQRDLNPESQSPNALPVLSHLRPEDLSLIVQNRCCK